MDAQSALLDAFASAFTVNNRFFSLAFTDAALDGVLLPHTLSGEEHVSKPFRFTVDCLGDDARIELKSLLGVGVDIAITLTGGGERVISGIVTHSQQLGSNGGFARYQLIVEPAFAVLRLRRNSRVFQDKSVVDIVNIMLDEHIATNPVFAQCFRHREQLTATYTPRSFCQQYRESDFAFIERLLREEGISYFFDFEHGADEAGLHTLVLFDAGTELTAAPQHSIRFHRADATEADDTIIDWTAQRRIQSGAVQLASYDYKGVYTQQGADSSVIDHGDAGGGLSAGLIDYDPQALYYGADARELNNYATLRQQAHDVIAKTFYGSGVVRGIGAAQWFTLDDHPAHEDDGEADRQFVVLSQTVTARNNLPDDFATRVATNIAGDSGSARDGAGYWNDFTAVRKTIPLVPEYSHTAHAKPTARGIQTALVVGPAGEEIFTDELGRIKIQFHWARPQDHDQNMHGASADNNDFSSCWIRVGYPSAGANWGHQFIPRIGQEVVVTFIEDDIDRPIVSAVIHNGQQTPPTFSGAGALPANKTLSGIKSQEYKGGRYNELLFDDTTSEIRTKLSSEHGKTQLNQGFLIHARTEGRGTPRGEGFELRTDNAGALRAAQGLLISTEPQPNAGSKQLDRKAAIAVLAAATQQADQWGEAAKSAQANQPETGKDQRTVNADFQSGNSKTTGHLHHLNEAANNLELKSNTDKDGASGSGDQAGQQALLILSGQNGIAMTTPQSATLAAGSNLDQIALGDTHQTTGRRWISNAAESISLFVSGARNTLKESFKLIAAKGNIQMQAQSADIEIDGDQSLTITSCKDTITASAQKEIILFCNGAQIKLSGGDIEVSAPGNISLKGATQPATGPTSLATEMPAFSTQNFAGKHRLVRPTDGQPLKDHPYQITMNDGSIVKGITNANGETSVKESQSLEIMQIDFGDKPL
jgi:type VI secretion system secreted protein VgrG